MHAIGLTGGIGTGKSFVARMLAERGAAVCDADAAAHALLAPGGAAEAAVVERFGPAVLGPDGAIDRARLGQRVFADPQARVDLEAITHPLIGLRIAEAARDARERSAPAFVVEAALLVETGRYRDFETLVVVRAEPDVVRARVAARDGLTPAEVEARIAAQATDEQRLAVADRVIDNSGPAEATARQVAALWDAIVAGAG